jgi:FKBP-type peptidyl-prolyl cis-trans isomerase
MKQLLITLLACVMCTSVAYAEQADEQKEEGISMKDVSYCLGLDMGRNFKELKVDVDLDMLVDGIRDGIKGSDPKLDRNRQRAIMIAFQKEMLNRRKEIMEERQKLREKMAEVNKEKGRAFLKENAKRKGIKTTESGLQFLVIKEGSGPSPKPTDTIKVNYKGTLLDGTEFDSTYIKGEPAVFKVQSVIPGWIEGIQLMKVGGKYKFFIPPDLAYAYRGAEPDIGPNETLIFEVELLGIEE